MGRAQSKPRPNHHLKADLRQYVPCTPDKGLLTSILRFPSEDIDVHHQECTVQDLGTSPANLKENTVETKNSELETKQITEDNSDLYKTEKDAGRKIKRENLAEDRLFSQEKDDADVGKVFRKAETEEKRKSGLKTKHISTEYESGKEEEKQGREKLDEDCIVNQDKTALDVSKKNAGFKTKRIRTEYESGKEEKEEGREKLDEDCVGNQDKNAVDVSKKQAEITYTTLRSTQTEEPYAAGHSSNTSTVDILLEDKEGEQEIDNSQPIIYLQGYPLTPSQLKKTQIITDPCMFDNIDNYMAQTPPHRTDSITTLAGYICKIAKDDLMKVRAIHQWIVGNIEYDANGLETGDRLPCDAESVLRGRCCVCAGYSNLFMALCRKCGLIVEEVKGVTKLKSWNLDLHISAPDDSDHVWNAVYVHNEWRLIDCTWDAGCLENKKFVRKKDDFYFLADPEIFLNGHFPFYKDNHAKSEAWQLTRDTLTYQIFCKLLCKSQYAYRYQVEPVSHIHTIVDVDKEVDISVNANTNSLCGFSAHLECHFGKNFDTSIFVYKKNNIYSVKIKPPDIMQYTLKMFGSQDNDAKELQHLFTYTINCKSTHSILFPYPSPSKMYGIINSDLCSKCTIRFPTQAFFQSNSGEMTMSFPLQGNLVPELIATLQHAKDEIENQMFVFMKRVASNMHLTVRLGKKGYYKLNFYTQELEAKTNKCMLATSYLIECDSPILPCIEYPTVSSYALQTEVSLLEPLYGVLQENTETRFRLYSLTLDGILLVNGKDTKTYTKDDNNIFDITTATLSSGESVTVYGKTSEMKDYNHLYSFKVEGRTKL